MYDISVPVMNSSLTDVNREKYAEALEAINAKRVFIAWDRFNFFLDDRQKNIDILKENVRFFENRGFETGVWIQAFGFGDPVPADDKKKTQHYTPLKSVSGRENPDIDAFCPSNEQFTHDYCAFVADVASVNPALIMLDDDLCLSVRPGLGCFCDEHMRRLEEKIGEKHSLEELKMLIFTGEENKYRTAWINVMGDTLRNFCRSVRKAVDGVNENIRVGFCAGYTSWDIEGADAAELTKILAGKTKPFLRFTGAPYWTTKHVNRFNRQGLNTVIECVRAQEKWCRDSGIEIFNEGDSYPRPRYHVPSSYIECFDIALRASGNMSALKYIFDYKSNYQYEQGYEKAHIKNTPLYRFIDEHFSDKVSVGVQVFENMRRIEKMPLPDEFIGEEEIMSRFFSPSAYMLTSHGISVTYDENPECAAAFGDNALYIEKLPKKLIIDIKAAHILQKKGIDCGIESAMKTKMPIKEHFCDEVAGMYNQGGDYYSCTFDKNAKVLSTFENDCGEFYPSAAEYDNGECRFLIFTFDAYTINQSSDIFLSYCRQNQLLEFTDTKACAKGNPGVYRITKKNGSSAAILILNIFEDELSDFVIELDKVYSDMIIYGAEGDIKGNIIKINSAVPPYGAIAIALEE